MSDDLRLCPDCGAEFRAHVAACSDCGTALVVPSAPHPLDLAYTDGLVPVSYPTGPMALRFTDALTLAGIPSCVHEIEFEDGVVESFLFVRPEHEATARRLADKTEMPTAGLRLEDAAGPPAVDEAWFDVPDVAPGTEEAAAIEKANWATALFLGSIVAVLLEVFARSGEGGWGGLVLRWGGAAVAALALAWRASERAIVERLRRVREQTAVGIDPDLPVAPSRIDDGPGPTFTGA